jgi:hypothetical protein
MLPSLQVVPFATLVAVPQIPVEGSQVDVLHVGALHIFGFDPMHTPFWQVSVCVHMLPSLQVVLFARLVGAEQIPVCWLHVPGVWHDVALQTTGFAPTHDPFWQLSVCVHAFPSLQFDPFVAFVGVGHCPVAGSQVPATLHIPAVHVVGVPGAHAPA